MSNPGSTYMGWISPERPAWSKWPNDDAPVPMADAGSHRDNSTRNGDRSYENAPSHYELTEAQAQKFVRTGRLPLNLSIVDNSLKAFGAHGNSSLLWTQDLDTYIPAEGNDSSSQPPCRHNPTTVVPDFHWQSIHDEYDDTIQFPHITLFEGDVLVFVDVPATKADNRPGTNCVGVVPCNQSFRVHSEKLLALKDSRFPALLNDEIYQARVRRRRNLRIDHRLGIKYFLDMTPPVEGDDRVFQMMSLSLPRGIMDWWSADAFHGVDPQLVCGHDDLCSCATDRSVADQKQALIWRVKTEIRGMVNEERAAHLASVGLTEDDVNTTPNLKILPPSVSELERLRGAGATEVIGTPPWFRIPDYCPIRHCNSIIRLFMMIEGKTIKMNSAARVWTMVGISKILECTSVVRSQVVGWILSNPRIIEVLPEEAFEIGFTLQLPQITQTAYRILVNELALEKAGYDDNLATNRRQFTIFGRRKGEIRDDERSNLIQHAAGAFIERVTSDLALMQSPSLFDCLDLPQWAKLRRVQQLLELEDDGTFDAAKKALRTLMNALVHEVNTRVEELAKRQPYQRNAYAKMDKDRATYVVPQAFIQIHRIPALTRTQNLLLPFFYNELGQRLQGNIYCGARSHHPDSNLRYFYTLMGDVVEELNKLLQAQPDRQHLEAWEMLFDHEQSADDSNNIRQIASLLDLEIEVREALRPIVTSWDRAGKSFVPQPNITRHLLLTLTHNEMKFLPLWAGGNNDGTGGVFESYVPPTDMGPNGPGPAYHTGLTIPSAPPSLSGSFLDDITAFNVKGSTTAGSVDVHDSISTVYRPERVIVADSSITLESVSGNDSEYDRARFEVPAEHQNMGRAVDLMVDSVDSSDDTMTIGANTDSDDSLDDFEDALAQDNDPNGSAALG